MAEEHDLLELLLNSTIQNKGTDLHLCAGSKPFMRVNGKLEEIEGFEKVMPHTVYELIDVLLDDQKKAKLAEKRVLDFSFSKPGIGRFRANVYSQRGTYAVAIRLLPFKIPLLQELGLPSSVASFTGKTKGLFLVTGPTGSGKSTTLASLLDLINEKYPYHILTIEDPIEYLHKHKKSLVTQREIGEDADCFLTALRAALREDPDVIMVGEMRDAETISIALMAAETGHLVFSTLHTIGTAKSIDRIIDAFPVEQQNQVRGQLASVLEGVVSQCLIPRMDSHGMALATEVMFVNTAIRNLIREGKHYQINSILQTGQAQGMQILEADLAKLYNQGLIHEDEMYLRAQDKQLLQRLIQRR